MQKKCESNCLKCSRNRQKSPCGHNGNTIFLFGMSPVLRSLHTHRTVYLSMRISDRMRQKQKYGLFCLHLAFIDTQNMAATLVNHSYILL